MTTSKKPEPGGSAGHNENRPDRLFDKQEREAVYKEIFDVHDGPRAWPGRRAELARGLRDLLAAPVAEIAGALQAGGLTAPGLPSALRLFSELHRVADALEAAEGGNLSGDETGALAVAIDAAWAAFVGEASAVPTVLLLFSDLHRSELQAEQRLRQDAIEKANPFVKHQGRRKELLPKTKLYEKFATLYPRDNVKAIAQLRIACHDQRHEGSHPFYWLDRQCFDRQAGKPISHTTMKMQLQKAREAMKKREAAEAKKKRG